jgi:hypothetical protein
MGASPLLRDGEEATPPTRVIIIIIIIINPLSSAEAAEAL